MGIFYNQNAKEDADRLKRVLIADKHFNPERIKQVIKSDITAVLKNYAVIDSENIFFDIEINSNGSYHFKIDAVADNLKIFGALPDN